MELKLIETGDKSKTLYHLELNEHYHSTHGAYQESVHVYIKSGLDQFVDKPKVSVFEMGFGTGLNVLLSWMFSKEHNKTIDLTTIELYPLRNEIWTQLDYYKNSVQKNVFEKLHQCDWEQPIIIDEHFTFTKHKVSLKEFSTSNKYELIFFDAFGPDKQPELWEIPVFEKLYSILNIGGILVTYSAKGQVRRNMQQAGFTVERIPGPPGKREMLRAKREK